MELTKQQKERIKKAKDSIDPITKLQIQIDCIIQAMNEFSAKVDDRFIELEDRNEGTGYTPEDAQEMLDLYKETTKDVRVSQEETVTISKSEYDELVSDSKVINNLKRKGVSAFTGARFSI